MSELSLFPDAATGLPSRLKAITLWQPWASAMAVGAKRYETRGYPAERLGLRSGDLLAIQAAVRRLGDELRPRSLRERPVDSDALTVEVMELFAETGGQG